MVEIYINKLPRILKNKKRLETSLKVKISNKGNDVTINGKPEDELIADQVLQALDLGFPFKIAMLIKEEDFMLEVINIKDHTKKHDLKSVRARIIGTGGKTLKTLSDISECFFELDEKNNHVGIIGDPESIESSHTALINLIKGAKTGNAYAYLEKHRPEKVIDLGLKK
jgi:KH domain-containing protein